MKLPRSHAREILDAPVEDRGELARSLAQVAQVNRWLGGNRATRHHLRRWGGRERAARVLDVGTGNGATLRDLLDWARRRGHDWSGMGLELVPQVAALARQASGTRVVVGDGLRLPFAADSFDVVFCTLTLHHFPEPAAVRLLREMARVSRGLVLANDLERSRANYLGARLLAATAWRSNRITRHDGPLSVLRSFTAGELLSLGRSAGLRELRVMRHVPFRLVLEGRP